MATEGEPAPAPDAVEESAAAREERIQGVAAASAAAAAQAGGGGAEQLNTAEALKAEQAPKHSHISRDVSERWLVVSGVTSSSRPGSTARPSRRTK